MDDKWKIENGDHWQSFDDHDFELCSICAINPSQMPLAQEPNMQQPMQASSAEETTNELEKTREELLGVKLLETIQDK